MKKALVLGVLAFFAINVVSVQNMNAQDRKDKKTVKVEKKDVKTEKKDAVIEKKSEKTGENDNTTKQAPTLGTDKKENTAKASVNQNKTSNKEINAVKKQEPQKPAGKQASVERKTPDKPVTKKEATTKPQPKAEK